jgi:hypothetical protein
VGNKVVASRRQVPLKLAWALSMHKSQVRRCRHTTVRPCGRCVSVCHHRRCTCAL